MVYVLTREGEPLMPTERSGWVAYAMKHGEAKVVRREPFTIMLLRDSTKYRQAVTLGVDAGSKHIGLCASTERKELYSSQVEMRDDVSKLLTARREFRRSRRGRKKNWYRKERVNNRANRRLYIKLPPSIMHKADAHFRAVQFVYHILPISKIRVELGKFDIRRIKDPNIEGEQYQQGVLAGWENLKAYAKWRDGGKCRVCGKSPRTDSSVRLEVHHIVRRANGGTDTPENVVTLCRECHEAHHKGERKLKLKRPPMHKGEAHMNAMRKQIQAIFTIVYGCEIPVQFTYGYETAIARREHGIVKSHKNDAYCIAGNFGAERNKSAIYAQKFVRVHNRMLHKARTIKGGIRRQEQLGKEVFGFRKNDKVRKNGNFYFIRGRRARGIFRLYCLSHDTEIECSVKKLILVSRSTSLLTEKDVDYDR